MLSILIPVFNYDITELVIDLYNQCESLNFEFEIIALDDASTEDCRPALELEHFKWAVGPENLGRAKARNKLVTLASYDLVLFLDADMKIIKPDFIKTYVEAASQSPVVCGGFEYAKERPKAQYLLRWNYGRAYEVKNASERAKEPYGSFMTGSFMATKAVLEKHPFDESLTIYGHEDTLLGKALLEDAIKTSHINNPALHSGLETNEEFILKTKEGLNSLTVLYNSGKLTRHYSGVIKLYERLKSVGAQNLAISLISWLEQNLGQPLFKSGKRLWLFQLLKLKWFAELQN